MLDAFPSDNELDLDAPLGGQIVFLRRVAEDATVDLLGHRFDMPRDWSHRLVRAEVDLDADQIHFHGLSRRSPSEQPRLRTVSHHVPRRARQSRP